MKSAFGVEHTNISKGRNADRRKKALTARKAKNVASPTWHPSTPAAEEAAKKGHWLFRPNRSVKGIAAAGALGGAAGIGASVIGNRKKKSA